MNRNDWQKDRYKARQDAESGWNTPSTNRHPDIVKGVEIQNEIIRQEKANIDLFTNSINNIKPSRSRMSVIETQEMRNRKAANVTAHPLKKDLEKGRYQKFLTSNNKEAITDSKGNVMTPENLLKELKTGNITDTMAKDPAYRLEWENYHKEINTRRYLVKSLAKAAAVVVGLDAAVTAPFKGDDFLYSVKNILRLNPTPDTHYVRADSLEVRTAPQADAPLQTTLQAGHCIRVENPKNMPKQDSWLTATFRNNSNAQVTGYIYAQDGPDLRALTPDIIRHVCPK